MQNTILQICKQIHELLPSHRIAITRFVGKYEYGQIYVGELDRNIKREPCDFMFAKRNFCVVYSQDPTKDQEVARQDFETVCQTLEDHCSFLFNPRWYKTFFDVFETTLILEFQVLERYERYKGTPDPVMGASDFSYPFVIYDGDTPIPPGPEPPDPPTPTPPDFSLQGLSGTIRVWGDEATIGTEFGHITAFGLSKDWILLSMKPDGAEPMSEFVEKTIGFLPVT